VCHPYLDSPGIGVEGHESPYLVGGSQDIIKTGNAFSNEPGIYMEGKVRVMLYCRSIRRAYSSHFVTQVGVRLEDCFYVDEDGKAVLLTEGVGGMAKSPWVP